MNFAIYTISKNEAHNVGAFMNAAEDCPVYVLDTGSTDNTVALLEQHGAHVAQKNIRPWRFDTARNEALALVPHDVDVCVSVDMDERLETGWKNKLKTEWSGNLGRTVHIDEWADEDCTIPSIKARHVRLHTRHNCEWSRPVHEVLGPCRGIEPVFCDTSILIKHYQKGGHRNYAPMLENIIFIDPNNGDAHIQLAAEYHQKNRLDEALSAYRRFIAVIDGDELEVVRFRRAFAWIGIAQCLHGLGRPDEMFRAFLSAIAAEPNCREAWTHFAHVAMQLNNAPLAYGAAMTAHRIQQPLHYMPIEAACWGDLPKQIADNAFGVIMKGEK